MRRLYSFTLTAAILLLSCALFIAFPTGSVALEEGEVTGTIERLNEKFLRDYGTLNYKGEKKWEKWGQGLKSLGWIVVQGDSGELKDYLLLVIDTRSSVGKADGSQASFSDFQVGQRVKASYRMGWDALHAKTVNIVADPKGGKQE